MNKSFEKDKSGLENYDGYHISRVISPITSETLISRYEFIKQKGNPYILKK